MTSEQTRIGVVVLSALLAVGCVVMAVAHAGVSLGALTRLGPGGSRAVPPAVIAFTAGAVALVLVAVGAARRRAWAWALGVVVHALVVLAAVLPFRGAGSAAAIVLSGAAVAALISPHGRRSLLTPRDGGWEER